MLQPVRLEALALQSMLAIKTGTSSAVSHAFGGAGRAESEGPEGHLAAAARLARRCRPCQSAFEGNFREVDWGMYHRKIVM
jgi:hypothetical protein